MADEASDVQNKIIGCVDAGLNELGASVKQAIYFHLDYNFHIKKEEIPNQPEAFSKALHLIFGTGAKVKERRQPFSE